MKSRKVQGMERL